MSVRREYVFTRDWDECRRRIKWLIMVLQLMNI